MKKTLDKIYDPKQFEDKIYCSWQQKKYFHADVHSAKPAFTIVIPPPNITGQLHMGHALDETLQDILIRFKRMQGFEALWLPGTDHASIATEVKIAAALREEGTSKEQIGREEFLKRAWDWKETYGGRIVRQLQKIGCSCDWERERFTLDEGCNRAVNEMFVRLYQKGLIYRGERIIHWCPKCKTSLSDAEVEYNEQQGSFWHLRYPLADGSAFLELATTRPETMLGDTAVAVHPDDPRYQHLIGRTVFVPLTRREVPIVADSYVDMEFGTGVVKITPAHDPNDFEVGQRHNLPMITVLTPDAKMTEVCGKYAGMDRYQARKQIIADLQALGGVVKIQPHTHNVGECYRCGSTVEPRVSKQWFVKMKPLAEPAIQMVKDGEIQFVPKRFEKLYFHWMENIRDWCISRQLWWGHRIPVWYCDDCGEMMVSQEAPESCSRCSGRNLRQDPDTLDTWFSSALWPFSTMGWPEQTKELERFYPTSALVTGYDIITFWVSRMVTAAAEFTGKPPFQKVLIHGLVRDEQGRKMSKSLGNGIDPLQVADEYGADALRFMLASGTNAGNDMRYSEEKVLAARNFANKLWNASRFVLMNLDEDKDLLALPTELCVEDHWVLTRMNQLVRDVTLHLENYDVSVASQKIYDFTWNVLCDWYIELCKTRLQGGGERAQNAQTMLVYLLTTTLQLLHPFMPFITEEIFQALPHQGDSIMISQWPEYRSELNFFQESEEFEKIVDAIKGIRNVRSEMKVPPSRKVTLYIQTESADIFEECRPFFERLAGAQRVEIGSFCDIADAVQVATDSARMFIPMDDLIDREKEQQRLGKEKETCENEIAALNKKLANQSFVEKAPAAVVEKERVKLERAQQKLKKIQQSLQTLTAH